jgi:3-phosphoshikimate 1-carboxyvinyltransferase
MKLSITKSGPLTGTLRPPSDKSLTHRAILFSSLAKGHSRISNMLEGEDCLATKRIFEQMGVQFTSDGDDLLVDSTGELQSPDEPLDCGNSGTTIRLMAGVLASRPGLEATLTGDASLSRRPMGRITGPLKLMGADIEGDHAPIKIHGRRLNGISYVSPVASAQVKSCILLAGLNADGETSVTEPAKSRDHTEKMLRRLGVDITIDGFKVSAAGGQSWEGADYNIPGDISSAAFWLCAAAMIPESDVCLTEVGINPTRCGVLEVLLSAGAQISTSNEQQPMGEPLADLTVVGSDNLEAFQISGAIVPRLVDEIPVLAVMATQCHGTTVIKDAKEMRVKETDRIAETVKNLKAMGAEIEEREDGMVIKGPTKLHGAEVDADGDHRIGMAFAVAGLLADGATTIHNADSIRTSYPEFEQHLRSLSES